MIINANDFLRRLFESVLHDRRQHLQRGEQIS